MIGEFYTQRERYSTEETQTYCGVRVKVYLQKDGTYIGSYGSLSSGAYWVSPSVGECNRTFSDAYEAHIELAHRWESLQIRRARKTAAA